MSVQKSQNGMCLELYSIDCKDPSVTKYRGTVSDTTQIEKCYAFCAATFNKWQIYQP